MSAYLASQATFNYIASGLYDGAERSDCDYHYTVRRFLGLDRDSTPEGLDQSIIEAVCKLHDLNRLALVTRYGDQWVRDDVFSVKISYAATVSLAQLIKCISCVLYQCSEYLTDETKTYREWRELEASLALRHFMDTPEYDAAEWGIAA